MSSLGSRTWPANVSLPSLSSRPHPSLADTQFLLRNLNGDNNEVSEEKRILRRLAMETTALVTGPFKDKGLALLKEGHRFSVPKEKWPLCVRRRDVSVAGSRVSLATKQKICLKLAKDFDHLEGSVQENYVTLREEALRVRSERRSERLSEARSLTSSFSSETTRPFLEHRDLLRERWLRDSECWFKLSEDMKLARFEDATERASVAREKTTLSFFDGNEKPTIHHSVSPHHFNEIPLRHISYIYPKMGIRPPGPAAASSAATLRRYEVQTLRPLRRAMKSQAHKRAEQRSLLASSSSLPALSPP